MPIKALVFLSVLFFSAPLMASTIDSVGVENLEGKQIILHKITAKETYYALGRKYGVNPAAIIDFNRNKALDIGTLVKVPTQRPFVDTKPMLTPQKEVWLKHQVKPKETLYSLAKKYNTTVDELKDINKLKINALTVGRVLKIRLISPAVATPAVTETQNTSTQTEAESSVVTSSGSADEERKLPPAKYGLREIKEKGVATWIEDESLDDGKMLALHPTAPVGTIIKITNPMSQKSTFAKVVGKFTENESNRGVIIIITKTAADLIGALDKRFQVNLVYGVSDEQ